MTLTVSDLKEAIGFQEGVLGLTKKYDCNDDAGFDCGGVEVGVKTWDEREEARGRERRIDLAVDDADDASRRRRA